MATDLKDSHKMHKRLKKMALTDYAGSLVPLWFIIFSPFPIGASPPAYDWNRGVKPLLPI